MHRERETLEPGSKKKKKKPSANITSQLIFWNRSHVQRYTHTHIQTHKRLHKIIHTFHASEFENVKRNRSRKSITFRFIVVGLSFFSK